MIYMKHKEHGNAHVADAEQAQREADGWMRWPRTRDEKLNRLATIASVANRIPQIAPANKPDDLTRDDMLASAQAHGVKIDRRWSNERILEELTKA